MEARVDTEVRGLLGAGSNVKGQPRGLLAKIAAACSAGVGAIAGIAPHVLHHTVPIAGAALLTGAAGTVLFGAVGFVLTVPMLLQVRRRFGTWRAPLFALAMFAVLFTISTLWVGPAIRGDGGSSASQAGDQTDDHTSHH